VRDGVVEATVAARRHPPRSIARLRQALVVPLFVLGSLLGAALVSALIFAVDRLLPATLLD
jgi:hypothetical protein